MLVNCGHSFCAWCLLADISNDFPTDRSFDDSWIPTVNCRSCELPNGYTEKGFDDDMDHEHICEYIFPLRLNERLDTLQMRLGEMELVNSLTEAGRLSLA